MTRARDLAAGTFELATGGVLKLETSDTTVTDGSVLGKIEFKAPDEASGTDANLTAAAIEAVAEGTFAADNNATELVFKTGASAAADAKMTLTSGGNLLVGTTNNSPATNNVDGISLRSAGHINVSRSSGVVGYFNRKTSDGTILDLRKDGTTVGSIAADGGFMSIGTGDVGLVFNSTVNTIHPNNQGTLAGSDGQVDLGYTNVRFKDLYLSGGVFLGGTGAANKLDDYEEGTWTPVLSVGTLNFANGFYTVIGNTCHFSFICGNPSNITSTDSFSISLPFTTANTSGLQNHITLMTRYFNFSNASMTGYISQNTNQLQMYRNGNNSNDWLNVKYSNASSGSCYVRATGFFFI